MILENLYTKERFISSETPRSKIVDGVKYIAVIKASNLKPVMIREDYLVKVKQK
jgi:hypothetical protein